MNNNLTAFWKHILQQRNEPFTWFCMFLCKKKIRGLGSEYTQDSTETDALLCLATKQTNKQLQPFHCQVDYHYGQRL